MLDAGYVVTFKQGWWRGVDHVGPGDFVIFAAKTGRLDVSPQIMVEELRISLGESGEETVEASLGFTFPDDRERLSTHRNSERIRDLERAA